MNRSWKIIGLYILSCACSYGATDAAIVGVVKDPAGVPFRGAFVHAQNLQSKITVNVMSDGQGRYRIANLPPGDYDISVTAVGYRGNPRRGVKVAAGDPSSLDFALQQGIVHWADLSLYQGRTLMPPGKGKEILDGNCFACHGFQTRMAAVKRDRDGWVQAVNFMLATRHARLGNHINDEDAAVLTNYLNDAFGVDAKLPKSPAELPGYKATLRPVSDEALKIRYVEYDMPGPNRMPFSAAPDKDGKLWIPDMGSANTLGYLDPNTGAVQEFTAPNSFPAGIHSAVPAPDGSVWISEQAANKVGHWDPKTKLISEYQDTYKPGMEGLEDGGSKHTVRVDSSGRVWGTAVFNNLTVYDPRNNEFSHFADTFSPYGLEFDKSDNVWFAEFYPKGKIGMVDAKTGKVTKWDPPTKGGWPRRIEIDDDGIVWFAEYKAGKIGRFDPKTQAFKEYELPGPSATPYALGIDRAHNIWYSSDEMDVIGRLNPKTGKVTEFPYAHPENMMKEFFLDGQGRMWYGSAPNNKVGYFVPSELN
ncbi:MAG TPA: carboxypeptidase regulatory-like domain-containing protein [Candidatus Acidoferrales bacterium]|nr:carboxypeptidase regulatory-like domain-containing protein [Candidatus Acidoferrales bacterium]